MKTPTKSSLSLLGSAALFLLASAGAGMAATTTWINAADGNWGLGSNWATGVPTTGDVVSIAASGASYTVTYDGTGVFSPYTSLTLSNTTGFTTALNIGAAGFSGATTTVGSQGVLNLNAAGVLNTGVLALTAQGTVNFNGGTLQFAAPSTIAPVSGASINVLAGGAVVDTQSYGVLIAQPILSGTAGDGGLTKLGSGALYLSGSNNYNGLTRVKGGTLQVFGATGSINNTSGLSLSNGAFIFDNTGSGLAQSGTLGVLSVAAGQGNITEQRTNTNSAAQLLTFSSLTARAAGTDLILATNSTAPSATNGFIITGQGAGFIDRGVIINNYYAWINATGNWVRAINYATDAGAATSSATTSVVGTGQHQQFTGAITAQATGTFADLALYATAAGNAFNVTLATGATVTTDGIMKSGGNSTTAISGGTGIQASGGNEMVVIVYNVNDILNISIPILQNGSNTNALTKGGAGPLTLSGNNTYTGVTTMNAGTLTLSGSNTGGGGVTVNGGQLNIGNAGALGATAGTFTLNGGVIDVSGGAVITNANNNAVSIGGDFAFSASKNLNLGTGTVTLNGAAGSRLVTVNNPGTTTSGTLTLGGGVVNGTATGLTKAGGGTLVLAGVNTYNGGTTINAGVLTLSSNTGSLNTSGALTFNGGTFNFDNTGASATKSQSLGALTFSTGNGTIQTTRTAAQDEAMTFASLTRKVGASGNFYSGGTNSGSNGFVITSQAPGFMDKGLFYGGNAYAWYDSGGFVRAMSYSGSDAGAFTSAGGASISSTSGLHAQVTGAVTAQTTDTFADLNISGSNNFSMTGTNVLTVNGILKTGGNGMWLTGNFQAANNAEMVINTQLAGDFIAINGGFQANGANALTKTGLGSLILDQASTYTGATYVAQGTLQIGNIDNKGSIANTSGITVASGATLNFNRTDNYGGNFTTAISGAGSITLAGGTLTLTGANTFTGTTAVNGGVLQVGNGGTVGSISSNISTSIASGAQLVFNRTDDYGGVFTSSITGAGTLVLNSGTLSLSGGNGWTGGTIINGGTLKSTQSFAGVNSAAPLTFANSAGANLDINGLYITVGTLNGGGALGGNIINAGAGNLTFGGATSGTYAGIISGASNMTKAGAGTQVFTGSNAVTGAYILNAGTVQIGAGGTAGSMANNAVQFNGGSLTFNRSDAFPSISGAFTGSGAVNVGSLTVTNGIVSLSGANTYKASTVVNGGELVLLKTQAKTTGGGTFNVAAGASLGLGVGTDGYFSSTEVDTLFNSTGATTLTGSLAGISVAATSGGGIDTTFANFTYATNQNSTRSLIKTGINSLILTGSDTFGTSPILVYGGTLQVGNAGVLGSIANDVTLSNGSILAFNRTDNYGGAYANTVSGSGGLTLSNGTLALTATNTYTGATTITTGTLQIGNAGTTGAIGSGTVSVATGAALAFNRTDNYGGSSFTNTITGAGGIIFNSGTLTLTNTVNNYSGATLINGGTLQMGADWGSVSQSSAVTVASGAVWDNNNHYVSVQSLSGSGSVLNIQQLQVGGNNTSTTFAGIITGTNAGGGHFTKLGTGTMTLTGANTYGGETHIDAGTLQIGNGGTTGSISNSYNVRITGSNSTLVFNRTDNYGGNFAPSTSGITGSGNVIVSAGTLTFGGGFASNTYSGTTNVNGTSTLIFLATKDKSANSAITVASTANLGLGVGGAAANFTTTDVDSLFANTMTNVTLGANSGVALDTSAGNFNYGSNQTTTRALIKTGSNNLILTGSDTFGSVTVNSGALQIGASGTAGYLTNNVSVANGASVAFNRTDNYGGNFGQVISGSGGLILNSGTLTLSIAQTYTGPTMINGGTLAETAFRLHAQNSAVWIANNASAVFDMGMFYGYAGSLNGGGALSGGVTGSTVSGTTGRLQVGFDNTVATYAGNISGPTQLEHRGTGTQILTGSTTFTGAIVMTSGSLQFGNGGTGGTMVGIQGILLNGGVLAFNQTGSIQNISGALTSGTTTGGLLVTNGVVNLSGANTYASTTTVNGGTLILGKTQAKTTGGGAFNVAAGASLGLGTGTAAGYYSMTDVDNLFTGTMTGNLAGISFDSAAGVAIDTTAASGTYATPQSTSRAFAKFGVNTLSLTGANTFGSVTVNAGTLQIGAGGTVGSISNNVSVASGATLGFNRTDDYGGSFANVISGAGGLNLANGTLALTGANIYSGATAITGGTLQIGNGGTTGSIGSAAVTVGAGAALGFNRTDNYGGNFANALSGSGGMVVNSGTLTLASANALTGTTVINGGTVKASTDWVGFSANSNVTMANSASAIIDVSGFYITLGALNGGGVLGGNIINSGSAGQLQVNPLAGKSGTYAGIMSGGQNFNVNGPGTQILTGSNTYLGWTLLTGSGSTLQIGNGGTTGSINSSWAVVLSNSSTLAFNRTDNYGGAWTTASGTSGTSISGTGGIAVNSGTLMLAAANTYTGTTAINGGTLQIGANGTTGSIGSGAVTVANGATLAFNRTDNYGGNFTKLISGSGGMTLNSGTLTLAGTNTYTGTTQINSGTLKWGISNFGNTMAPNSAVVMANNPTAILDLNGVYQIIGSLSGGGALGGNVINSGIATALTINGNNTSPADYAGNFSGQALKKNGNGTQILSGSNSYNGLTYIYAGILQIGNGGATGSISKTAGISLGGGTLAFNRTDNYDGNFSPVISGTTSAGAVALNSGTLVLTGLNTYFGAYNVNGGTLQIGASGTAGSITSASGVTVADGATLAFSRTDNYGGDFTPAISGSGGLSLNSGTLTLAAVNSYTGNTLISAGKLAVNGSTAVGSAVTVASGGTLGGSGNVQGTVNVQSGGHFAPGNSISDAFQTGGLTLNAGALTDIELGTMPSSPSHSNVGLSDMTTVTGDLALGGSLNLIDNAGALTSSGSAGGSVGAGSYKIFGYSGALSGSFSGINNISGYHARVDTATGGSVFVDNYQLASANTITDVALGNFHVGSAPTATRTFTNGAVAGYGESLSVSGSSTGGATVSVPGLIAGGTSGDITVGATAGAGSKDGTVVLTLNSDGTGTSGYGQTSLPTQTVNVSGTGYDLAAADATQTVNVGITHVNVAKSATVTVANTAPASATYTETLSSNGFSGTTAGFSATGSVSGIAGGSNGSGTLQVTMGSGFTAGAHSGTTSLALNSNEVNSSGLGTTALSNQLITINGQVNEYASPALAKASGDGALSTIDANTYSLDLGKFDINTGVHGATLALSNTLVNAIYQDLLSGNFTTTGLNGFSFSVVGGTLGDIAIGGSNSLLLSFDTTGVTAGNYTGQLVFNPLSINASGTSSMSAITIDLGIQAAAVPEPTTWAMLVGGMGMLALTQRIRRRSI